jgi:hypothetical protein
MVHKSTVELLKRIESQYNVQFITFNKNFKYSKRIRWRQFILDERVIATGIDTGTNVKVVVGKYNRYNNTLSLAILKF